jgi:hypothetical protein
MQENGNAMKTMGWLAVQVVGFALGIVFGYYEVMFAVEYGQSLVEVEAILAATVVGTGVVVVRSIRHEAVGGSRVMSVPIASVLMGMAASATFYGLLVLWLVHMLSGGGGSL